MFYQRSFVIERRLDRVLELIRTGGHSTQTLAQALGVSVPTVSRCLAALRERGYTIQPRKAPGGWYFTLAGKKRSARRAGPGADMHLPHAARAAGEG